ncbi:MAG: response regulator transcription factor [Dichotomicrobium sp.]
MKDHHLIVVDDHPLFRDALKQILRGSIPGLQVSECGSFDDLARTIESGTEVDLVLLDLALPGADGLSALIQLRVRHPELPVVVVSASEAPVTVRRCLQLGALGFIPKSLSAERIREAVEAVLSGRVWTPAEIDLNGTEAEEVSELLSRMASLTPQQVRVLAMLSEGLLNKQIAYKLGVSEATVKAHVSAILQKLGVDSRTQAVIAMNKIDSLDPRVEDASS